jgi:hypothetical protein
MNKYIKKISFASWIGILTFANFSNASWQKHGFQNEDFHKNLTALSPEAVVLFNAFFNDHHGSLVNIIHNKDEPTYDAYVSLKDHLTYGQVLETLKKISPKLEQYPKTTSSPSRRNDEDSKNKQLPATLQEHYIEIAKGMNNLIEAVNKSTHSSNEKFAQQQTLITQTFDNFYKELAKLAEIDSLKKNEGMLNGEIKYLKEEVNKKTGAKMVLKKNYFYAKIIIAILIGIQIIFLSIGRFQNYRSICSLFT